MTKKPLRFHRPHWSANGKSNQLITDDVIVVVLQDFHFKDGYLICDNSDIMYGSMPIDGDLEPTTMYAGTVKIKKIK